MSRPELKKLLKKKHPKLIKPQLETIIDTFFQSIEEALMKKRPIELRGFGTFFIKEIKFMSYLTKNYNRKKISFKYAQLLLEQYIINNE